MSVSLSLSVCKTLCACLYHYIVLSMSLCLFLFCLYIFICLSSCLYLSVYVCLFVSVCLCVCLYLPVCLSVSLYKNSFSPFCITWWETDCLSVCQKSFSSMLWLPSRSFHCFFSSRDCVFKHLKPVCRYFQSSWNLNKSLMISDILILCRGNITSLSVISQSIFYTGTVQWDTMELK